MDAKSTLQQRVLALGRGYTASDIKYKCRRSEGDRWFGYVTVGHVKFSSWTAKRSKQMAEVAAAEAALAKWKPLRRTLLEDGKDDGGIQEEEEVDEDDCDYHGDYSGDGGAKEPSREEFEKAGRLLWAAIKILQPPQRKYDE